MVEVNGDPQGVGALPHASDDEEEGNVQDQGQGNGNQDQPPPPVQNAHQHPVQQHHHHYYPPPADDDPDQAENDVDTDGDTEEDDPHQAVPRHHPRGPQHRIPDADPDDDDVVQLGRLQGGRNRNAPRANFDFKAIQPDVFHGLSTEFPTRWMRQFEAYCSTKKISDDQTKALFKLLMRSRAQVWADSFDRRNLKTWRVVRSAFLDEFESPTAMWHNQNKLDERKLKADETPDQYINDVLQLTSRLYMSKQGQMKALIRGLPPKVKGNVLYHNHRDLNDVIHAIQLSAMCEDMSVSKPSSKSSKSLSRETDEVQAKLVATCKAVTDHLDDQLQDSTSKMKRMKVTHAEEEEGNPGTRPPRGQRNRDQQQPAARYVPAQGGGRFSRGNGRPMRRQMNGRNPNFRQVQGTPRSLRDIQCFNCRKRGHMARDCRAPRSGDQQAPQQQYQTNGNQPTQWVRVIPATQWPTQSMPPPPYSIPSAAIEGYHRQENTAPPGQWPALPAPQPTAQITECVMPLN